MKFPAHNALLPPWLRETTRRTISDRAALALHAGGDGVVGETSGESAINAVSAAPLVMRRREPKRKNANNAEAHGVADEAVTADRDATADEMAAGTANGASS